MTRLLPHQLAVAIAGGPEIFVHSARDWIARNKGREDMIFLQKDINNIFNTMLPSVFLEECRQYDPASSRFAAWCYGSVGFPFGSRGVYICQFKRTTGMPNDDGFVLAGPQATYRGSRNSNRNHASIPAGICGRWLLCMEGSGCYPVFSRRN